MIPKHEHFDYDDDQAPNPNYVPIAGHSVIAYRKGKEKPKSVGGPVAATTADMVILVWYNGNKEVRWELPYAEWEFRFLGKSMTDEEWDAHEAETIRLAKERIKEEEERFKNSPRGKAWAKKKAEFEKKKSQKSQKSV